MQKKWQWQSVSNMVITKCIQCGSPKSVRQVDLNRGWGKFCSKSCKAVDQERKTGQHAVYLLERGVSHMRVTPKNKANHG